MMERIAYSALFALAGKARRVFVWLGQRGMGAECLLQEAGVDVDRLAREAQ